MPTSDIVRINWILRLSVNEEDPILIDTIQCDWQQSHQVPNLATEEFANHMVTKHHQIEHHKIEICIFTTKTLIIHQSKRFSLVTIRNLQKTQIPITIWNLDTIIWSSEYFHPCDTSSDSWMNKNEKLRQKGEMDMFWYRVHLDRLYCHRVEQKKCFLNEKKSCFFLSKSTRMKPVTDLPKAFKDKASISLIPTGNGPNTSHCKLSWIRSFFFSCSDIYCWKSRIFLFEQQQTCEGVLTDRPMSEEMTNWIWKRNKIRHIKCVFIFQLKK